jgi:16S rRNA processing protein RimM
MKDLGRKSNNHSGSLKKSEPDFLAAGKLRKPHGLNGEMWIEVLTDYPELFDQGIPVFMGESFNEIIIKSFRMAGKLGLVRFEGFETPESLRSFNNAYLYFDSKDLPALQEEEYFHHELIGLEVRDEDGTVIGTLTEILVTGANDVYVVTSIEGKKELLIPAIKSVVKKIDIESRQMIISPQEWDM